MRHTTTVAAGALLGLIGLGAVPAIALPAMPQPGIIADGAIETVRHRGYKSHHDNHYHSHMGRHRTTKRERSMRRRDTMRHGNPNARNPERSGHQQQLGATANGPRY